MQTEHVIFGDSLETQPGEAAALAQIVQSDGVAARKVVAQPDGDIRYWDVELSHDLFKRLMDFACNKFEASVGRPPARAFIMVNHIEAERSPEGSGGQWHRDSFRHQYKAFLYLTDVDKETQGPFCCLPSSNKAVYRAASALAWIMSGRKSFNQPDWMMNVLLRLGLRKTAVLAKAGVPFYADTSLIHRGLPITEGRRIAATVYMLGEGDDVPPVVADGQ